MTERKKLSLTKPVQTEQDKAPDALRKPPVRGEASVPRKRMSAAEAAQAREAAATRAEREAIARAQAQAQWAAERAASRGPGTGPRDQRDPRAPRAPQGGPMQRNDRFERTSPRGADQGQRPAYPDRPARPEDTRPARQDHRRADGRGPRPDPRQDPRVQEANRGFGGFEGRRARPSAPAAPERSAPDDGRVRLSKLMSERGLSSRREADEWIEHGWVRVNGEVVAELGSRFEPTVEITIDPMARTQQSERVTILIHKPIGYVSGQAEDGYEPAAVLIKAENRWADDRLPIQLTRGHLRHLAPAGRLDIDSTGMLVLTQDGRIAKHLIGEDSGVEKEYLVRVQAAHDPEAEDVSAIVPPEVLEQLRFGLELDGRQLKHAQVSWQNEHQLRFVLREGRKRQIRRMCELVGLKVVGLKRVRMGSVTLGKLPLGQWRFLRPDERF